MIFYFRFCQMSITLVGTYANSINTLVHNKSHKYNVTSSIVGNTKLIKRELGL